MTILNLSFDGYDFKQIAEIASRIRLVGDGLGLIGVLVSYIAVYMYQDSPQCIGSMITDDTRVKRIWITPCDVANYIFFISAGISASGLIGLPWDILVLWATKSIPDKSSVFQDSSFQIAIFGFLALNLGLIVIGDEVIEAIILNYQINFTDMFPFDTEHENYKISSLVYLLQTSVLYSLIADFILIPLFVQLVSTASYSYFVYQNQPGV